MTSQEIQTLLSENKINQAWLYKMIKELGREQERLERDLVLAEKKEAIELRNNYLKQFGFENEVEARRGKYLVFNKKGRYIKTVDVNRDFEGKSFSDKMEEFEKWLKETKVYSHNASSFCDRPNEWYSWSFQKQLENLGWTFSKKGTLTDCAW